MSIKDYNELDKMEPIEGGKVLVMYSDLIHQFIDGRWEAIGRLDKNGRVICEEAKCKLKKRK